MEVSLWSVWELMGDTDRRTRGRMRDSIRRSQTPRNWNLVDTFASVGSSGPWPHVIAAWQAASSRAVGEWLESGSADGIDEASFSGGRSTLATAVRGSYPTGDAVFRYERVVTDSAATLREAEGPDFVLADVFCPWQGIALWGATDLDALAKRERAGIGWAHRADIVDCVSWWIARMPDRDIV